MRKRDKKKRNRNRAARVQQSRAKVQKLDKYICQVCGGSIVTIERNDGITPPVISCKATDGCTGAMTSNFNLVRKSENPSFEFYRPKLYVGAIDDETRRYLDAGGLVLRKISNSTREIVGVKNADSFDVSKSDDVTVIQVNDVFAKESFTFRFDRTELDALRAGKLLDWDKISGGAFRRENGEICPPPPNVRKEVMQEILKYFNPPVPETIAERGKVTADDVRKIAGKYATENNRGQNE